MTQKIQYRLLLIEDNPFDIHGISQVLQELNINHSLHIINNGKDALNYIKSLDQQESIKPHLIILDITLPGVPGDEILKYIKLSINLCYIPVMVFSSINNQQIIHNIYKDLANCFIQKPDNIDIFYDTVKNSIYDFWIKTVYLQFHDGDVV